MARKEKKYNFIYKTTNLLSGKYYYGMHSTDNLEDGYMGSGRRLRYSLNKYGNENHKREIIEFCINRKELKKREKEIINLNEIAKEDCMNLMVGGEGGYVSIEHYLVTSKIGGEKHKKRMGNDEEYRKKTLSILDTNRKNMWDNIELKEKLLKNINWIGRSHKEETKKRLSEIKKGAGLGKDNSQYGTCWVTRIGENKKIKKEELPEYTSQGWVKGRKIINKNGKERN